MKPTDSNSQSKQGAARPPRPLWVLIGREFDNRARKKGFWVFTIIGLLLLIGLTFLPNLMQAMSTRTNTKVVFNDPSKLIAPVVAQTVQAAPDKFNFRVAVDDTTSIDGYSNTQLADYMKNQHTKLVVAVKGDSAATASFTFVQEGNAEPTTIASVQSLLRQQVMNARMQQLPADAKSSLAAPVPFSTNQLQEGSKSLDQVIQSQILVYTMMILLFVTMAIYGAWVGQGIVEEKSNRIIEMMLVASQPWEIMTGKIVGIGLVGLLQYLIWLVGAGVTFTVQKQAFSISLSAVPISTFVLLPIFFILGYFLYATLYAIAGSLVYRPEDQQMSVTPVAMVMVLLFYIALFGVLPNPTSVFAVVVSYIPLFTPLTMFARAALTSVPIWEVLISVVLTIAFNAVLILYGAKVYKRFALRTSGKAGWRLLWHKEGQTGTQAH